MPTILGIEFSDRIEKMEAAVTSATGKPVNYELLVGDPQELLCRGECEWSPDGAVIRLPADSDEYSCAHELAHALMIADGFPSAATEAHENDKAFTQAVGCVSDAVHHPVLHSKYLPAYGYAEEVKKHYADAVEEMLSPPGRFGDKDDPRSFDVTFHATGILEFFFGARDRWGRIEAFFQENAPNTWKLARILVAASKNDLQPNPYQVRRVIVNLLVVLDRFLEREADLKVGFLQRAVVGAMVTPRQAHQRAQEVFYLTFSDSKVCYKRAALRMKQDGSCCHLWSCRNEQDVLWTKRALMESTALELLNKIDSDGFRARHARS